MKNLTWQNPEQLFVAQELINKVKSKCCGIKAYNGLDIGECDTHFVANNSFNQWFSIDFHAQNEENRSNIDDYQGKIVTLRMDGGNSFQDIWNKRSVMLLL